MRSFEINEKNNENSCYVDYEGDGLFSTDVRCSCGTILSSYDWLPGIKEKCFNCGKEIIYNPIYEW